LRRRPGRAARAGARLAQRGGVDLDRTLSSENGVDEVNLDPKQGVISAFLARTRSALLPATEERVENVAHRTETGHTTLSTLATHVIVSTLLGVTEDVERVCDELEPIRRVLRRVDVGVEFTGELAISLFDFVLARVSSDTENVVVVH
jgi:hypothetical protein